MTKDQKTRFLTYHTIQFIKIDVFTVLHQAFFLLSAIKKLDQEHQKRIEEQKNYKMESETITGTLTIEPRASQEQ